MTSDASTSIPSGADYASAPVMGALETARVLSTLVDVLSTTPSTVVMGSISEYSDPIAEGLRRIRDRQAPLLIERTLIPGDPRTKEMFDVREMILDEPYLSAVLDFHLDTTVPESGMSLDAIIERMGQWKKPALVTGAYSLEGAAAEIASEAEDAAEEDGDDEQDDGEDGDA